MKFDLCVVDWTAISSVITGLMTIATAFAVFVSIRANKHAKMANKIAQDSIIEAQEANNIARETATKANETAEQAKEAAIQANELTEKVILLEKNKLSPYLALTFDGMNGHFAKTRFYLKNCSEYPACEVELKEVKIEVVDNDSEIISTQNAQLSPTPNWNGFIAAQQQFKIEFVSNNVILQGNQKAKFTAIIKASDITGTTKITTVTMISDKEYKFNYKYDIAEDNSQ
jgi:hypothetical protein